MLEGVVCICSRGLVHSRTTESVEKETWERIRTGALWRTLYTHDKPIPDAQNDITCRALALEPRWVWYVEEDVQVRPDTLKRMLIHARHAPVVTVDYSLGNGNRSVRFDSQGRFMFSGMGCLLVSSDVLKMLPAPIFRAESYRYYEKDREWAPAGPVKYGGQDIYFSVELCRRNIPVAVCDFDAHHWQVDQYGTGRSNDGCHEMSKR